MKKITIEEVLAKIKRKPKKETNQERLLKGLIELYEDFVYGMFEKLTEKEQGKFHCHMVAYRLVLELEAGLEAKGIDQIIKEVSNLGVKPVD